MEMNHPAASYGVSPSRKQTFRSKLRGIEPGREINKSIEHHKGGEMTKDIEYTVQIWKEGNQFVAHAMPLDVMSSGSTPEEARKALAEAVHLFLMTATDMGALEEILQEAGYEFEGGRWVSPSWVAIERHSAIVGV
jgi:predicted RNase H-like HicB family nuclease